MHRLNELVFLKNDYVDTMTVTDTYFHCKNV